LADPARPDLGRCLAALGISHILLAHEADWSRLAVLERRPDMRVVGSWPDLTLLALRQPGTAAMTAPAAATGRCPTGLRPLASRQASPVRVELLAPVPPGRRLVLGLPDAFDWRRSGNQVLFTPWPSYRRVYIVAIAGWLVVVLAGALALVLTRTGRRRPRTLSA